MSPVLARYIHACTHLHRAKLQGVGAPHKPVLLLAVLEGIAAGEIADNRIYITPELVARFKDVWSRLVQDDRWTADFTKPFYHLRSEGFWHLVTRPGREFVLTGSGSPKSFSGLKEWVAYVRLDEQLFALLHDPVSREALRLSIMEHYFPAFRQQGKGYIETVADQMLHESAAQYRQQAATFDAEETVARSAVFKRVIPKIYRYTCCVSGMRIEAPMNLQMVDACHIVPFAESQDDTVGNGLSLCPNLHRAFDRGLFRIDDEYRVVVSPRFREEERAYGIRGFAGQRILLPAERAYYPLRENLERHWLRWAGNFG